MSASACLLPRNVLPQLERAAVLLMFAMPSPRRCTCRQVMCVCQPHGRGVGIRCSLHRLESRAGIHDGSNLYISQQTGRQAVGAFSASVKFYAQATRGENNTPDIPWDPNNTRYISMLDCQIDFGHGWEFHGEGEGESYPTLVNGNPVVYITACGELHCRRYGTEVRGVFATAGTLTQEGDFSGTINCRIADFEGLILKGREVPTLEAMRPPDPDAAFIVVRAASPADDSQSAAKVTGSRVELSLTAELRSAEYLFGTNESMPLRAAVVLGQSLGELSAAATLEYPPDKTRPSGASLTARLRYSFRDRQGCAAGTLAAKVTTGKAWPTCLPGVTEAETFNYAGVGLVAAEQGTVAGLSGFLSVTGSMAADPAVAADVGVFTIIDSAHRLRDKPIACDAGPGSSGSLPRYLPMVDKLNQLVPTHQAWRATFKKHAPLIASTLARRYNEVLQWGDFPGLRIDDRVFQGQLEGPLPPFRQEVFERYSGAASGHFRFYSQATGLPTGDNTLYSYWNRTTFRFGTRYCKFISGSFSSYIPPDQAPPFEDHRFDPIVNSYREDTGVVSYIHVYQGRPGGMQERSSFAYKMPGPYELMWIVKDLSFDGQPADPDLFMSSHEWKDLEGPTPRYLMVGMFWRLDADRGTLERADDVLWRALYTEEPASASK